MKNKLNIQLLELIIFILILFVVVMVWIGVTPGSIGKYIYKAEYVNGTTVYLEEDVFNLLSSRYGADKDEFIYCMYGTAEEDYYVINNIKETPYRADSVHVSYKPCSRSRGYLGNIHSHPTEMLIGYVSSCGMSKQDIYTFGSDGSTLSAIICGNDKLAFYEADNLYDALDYEVLND